MAYDRYENRRGWREVPRSSQDWGDDRRDNRGQRRGWDRDEDDRNERGFLERAGDQIASWFGEGDSDRQRRDDGDWRREGRWQGEDNSRRRQGSFMSDDDYDRYDRQARFRDEGYRRPYTGRFSGGRSGGDDDRYRPMTGDYGRSSSRDWDEDRRSFTGMASTARGSQLHDPHYSEWRRRQIDALDRDYDEYRRENQSRFESEFSNWRTNRQSKRQLLGQVREHMTVVGSDEQEIGKVDRVHGDHIVLTRNDSDDGRHHQLSCTRVDRIEGDRVILDQTADEAQRNLRPHDQDRGMFRDDEDRETGPHMLNRSFSGTYER